MFDLKVINSDNEVTREELQLSFGWASDYTGIRENELRIVKSVVITYTDDSRVEVIRSEMG